MLSKLLVDSTGLTHARIKKARLHGGGATRLIPGYRTGAYRSDCPPSNMQKKYTRDTTTRRSRVPPRKCGKCMPKFGAVLRRVIPARPTRPFALLFPRAVRIAEGE